MPISRSRGCRWLVGMARCRYCDRANASALKVADLDRLSERMGTNRWASAEVKDGASSFTVDGEQLEARRDGKRIAVGLSGPARRW